MNEPESHPDDAKLGALLRESRAQPALPPRFQEAVWRRIEETESSVRTSRFASGFDALVAWALRPRFALAVAILLVAAGSLVGARQGRQMARQQAETRYIASVAPNSLR